MAEINIDWAGLAGDLKNEVIAGLRGVVDGTAEDLRTFGLQIGMDLVRAVREKREDLIEEVKHQAQVLAEVQRIRLVAASWDEVGRIIAVAGRVAMKALAAVAVSVV